MTEFQIKHIETYRLKRILDTLLPLFEKYKDVPDMELEFRLGFYTDNLSHKLNNLSLSETASIPSFDTNLPEEYFEKVKECLETNPSWEEKRELNQLDYRVKWQTKKMKTPKILRISETPEKKTKVCIEKVRYCTVDIRFENTPFDLRVSFSREIPCKIPSKKTRLDGDRYKSRYQYKHRLLYYDLTNVTYVKNKIEKKLYEIELEFDLQEFLRGQKTTSTYLLHSGFLKFYDIVNMCEPIPEDAFLEILRVKEYDC